MTLLETKANHEGVDLLTVRAAVSGRSSNESFLRLSHRLVWCRRGAAWVMRSTQEWLGKSKAQTNSFVDDPIIPLQGTTRQRQR